MPRVSILVDVLHDPPLEDDDPVRTPAHAAAEMVLRALLAGAEDDVLEEIACPNESEEN